mmetsp:Transcript_69313/g.202934  ORF Transcript_69313/g.202934 Transcript_69313/m.202934 type:complete len:383 (+) Transcript_69313:250-1398(+)
MLLSCRSALRALSCKRLRRSHLGRAVARIQQVVMARLEEHVHVYLAIRAWCVQADELSLLPPVQDPEAEAHAQLDGQGFHGRGLSIAAHGIHDAPAEVFDVTVRGVHKLAIRKAVGRELVRALEEEEPDEAPAGADQSLVHAAVLGDPLLQLRGAAPRAQVPQEPLVAPLLRLGGIVDLLEHAEDLPPARPVARRQQALQGPEDDGPVEAVAVPADGAPVAVGLREASDLADLRRVESALVLKRADSPQLADVAQLRAAGPVGDEHLVRGVGDRRDALVKVGLPCEQRRPQVAADIMPRCTIGAQQRVPLGLGDGRLVLHGRERLHHGALLRRAVAEGGAPVRAGADALLAVPAATMVAGGKLQAHGRVRRQGGQLLAGGVL